MQEIQTEQTEEVPVKTAGDEVAHRLRRWRGTIGQSLRYCLVGGANTLIDVSVLNAFLWCFPTHTMQLLVGYNAVAYASGAVNSFFLHKYWTFGRTQRPTHREVRRFVISLALELLVNTGLVWLASMVLSPFIANATLWGNAAKVVAMVGSAICSYVCLRFWTFASGSEERAASSRERSWSSFLTGKR
jgi:putative flippase GtrA